VGEAVAAENGGGLEGADAVVAVDDDAAVFVGGKFGVGAGVELVEGDEGGAINLGEVEFLELAYVQEEEVFLAVEPVFELGRVDFPFGVDVELEAADRPRGDDGLAGVSGGRVGHDCGLHGKLLLAEAPIIDGQERVSIGAS
jgi:hypothetical protein